MKHKIFPLGETALTIEFGNEISPGLNNQVLKLADYFSKNPFQGLVELVPAYASLSVFYDLTIVRKNFSAFPNAFSAIKNLAETALENSPDFHQTKARLIEIPVCFDKKYALDLEFVAAENNLTAGQVIKIFTAKIYRVYMLGFLPGFSYMGEVDASIAAPRKLSPRLQVPKGSVGIAGRQTGIYSLRSPGGWQIIGRTNVEMFTPKAESPTFLQAGYAVKFYQKSF